MVGGLGGTQGRTAPRRPSSFCHGECRQAPASVGCLGSATRPELVVVTSRGRRDVQAVSGQVVVAHIVPRMAWFTPYGGYPKGSWRRGLRTVKVDVASGAASP